MFDHGVHYGRPRGAVDWREIPDTDSEDDDEEISVTRAGLVAALGFDPLEGRSHVFQPGHSAYNPDMSRDERGRFSGGGAAVGEKIAVWGVRADGVPRPTDFSNMKSLGVEERQAVRDYVGTEGGQSFLINRYLREGTPPELIPGGKISQSLDDDIKALDSAISKCVVEPGEIKALYRGIDIAHLRAALGREPRAGDVIADKAYTSTSTDRKWALGFGEDRKKEDLTVLEISVDKPIHAVASIAENEVVLPRGQRFRIAEVSEKTEKVWIWGRHVDKTVRSVRVTAI